MTSTPQEDIELRRQLQLLKSSSGEYVASTLTDFHALVAFIKARDEQQLQDAYESGHETGFDLGYKTAHADAYGETLERERKIRLDELESASIPDYFIWNKDGVSMTIKERKANLTQPPKEQ